MERIYHQSDVVTENFLRLPFALLAAPDYRTLSPESKLVYALLLDRMNLSQKNGWINENGEVYLIYTREEVADTLNISYKKSIAAFKELISVKLLCEKRQGRGYPNLIFVLKPELNDEDASKFSDEYFADTTYESEEKDTESADNTQMCQNSISRTAETEVLDMPESHTNNTYINKTYINHTENSQSVSLSRNFKLYMGDADEIVFDRQTDDIYNFDEIIERCELEFFDEEERKILYDALERMYFSDGLKIGNAKLPQDKVRSRMYELDASILRSAMHNLHKNDREISNITAYVMSTIFNCITEEYSLLHVDPYLNMLRSMKKEE